MRGGFKDEKTVQILHCTLFDCIVVLVMQRNH